MTTSIPQRESVQNIFYLFADLPRWFVRWCWFWPRLYGWGAARGWRRTKTSHPWMQFVFHEVGPSIWHHICGLHVSWHAWHRYQFPKWTQTWRYIESAFAEKVAALPTRYLPPGTVKMLWYEFSMTNPSISYLIFKFRWALKPWK